MVLDVRLPEMSGLKLQEELTKAEIQVPIVFVSGHGEIAMAVRAMREKLLYLQQEVDRLDK